MAARLDWAQAQYAKSSTQTKQDIDILVNAFRISKKTATALFQELADQRGWKLWEGAAIADTVKALATEVQPLAATILATGPL